MSHGGGSGGGETIKSFLVGLGFDVDDAGLSKFKQGIAGATLAAASLATALAYAVHKTLEFVGETAAEIDKIGDLAERINTTSDAIENLSYVAELTDSSAEAAQSSMEGFSRTVGQVSMGIGRAVKIFKTLGIETTDSSGKVKDTAVVWDELGEKLKKMKPNQRLGLLSRLGIDATMVRALTEDTRGLVEERESMERAAGIDSEDAARKADAYVNASKRLGHAISMAKEAIAIPMMATITKGYDAMRKWIVANMEKITNIGKTALTGVLAVGEVIIGIGLRISQMAGFAIDLLTQLSEKTGGWSTYILAAAAAWKYLNLAFLKSPVAWLMMLVLAIGLLIDDFLVWREGGKSMIDWGSNFGRIMGVVAIVVGTATAIIGAFKVAVLAAAAAQRIMWAINNLMVLGMWALNAAGLLNPFNLMVIGILALIALVPILLIYWKEIAAWLSNSIIGTAFAAAADATVAAWTTVKTWFSDFFGWILDKFSSLSDVASWVSSLFGGGGTPAATLTPSPATASTLGGTAQNNNFKAEVTVVTSSGTAEGNGREVGKAMRGYAAEQARLMGPTR